MSPHFTGFLPGPQTPALSGPRLRKELSINMQIRPQTSRGLGALGPALSHESLLNLGRSFRPINVCFTP